MINFEKFYKLLINLMFWMILCYFFFFFFFLCFSSFRQKQMIRTLLLFWLSLFCKNRKGRTLKEFRDSFVCLNVKVRIFDFFVYENFLLKFLLKYFFLRKFFEKNEKKNWKKIGKNFEKIFEKFKKIKMLQKCKERKKYFNVK